MEKVKITFELSKEYVKGVLAVLGVENEIPMIMEAIGEACTIDIDDISKDNKDLVQMKMALVAMIMCQVGKEKV